MFRFGIFTGGGAGGTPIYVSKQTVLPLIGTRPPRRSRGEKSGRYELKGVRSGPPASFVVYAIV